MKLDCNFRNALGLLCAPPAFSLLLWRKLNSTKCIVDQALLNIWNEGSYAKMKALWSLSLGKYCTLAVVKALKKLALSHSNLWLFGLFVCATLPSKRTLKLALIGSLYFLRPHVQIFRGPWVDSYWLDYGLGSKALLARIPIMDTPGV